jgi:hypothetical protein
MRLANLSGLMMWFISMDLEFEMLWLTFVGEPGLEEGFDLAGASHEGGTAAGTFALGDVDREVGVGFERPGG